MKTLTEFIESNNVLPIIETGIGPASFIAEDVSEHVEESEHFPLILPNKSDFPNPHQYYYRSAGMWVAKDHSHVLFRDQGSETKVPMEHVQRMHEVARKSQSSWDRDLKKASDKLIPEYGQYQTHHLKVIGDYATNSIDNANRRLTEGIPLSSEQEKKVATLDDAIHTHSTPHAFTVYTGISREHSEKVVNSPKVHHPAFLSTSLSPHIAAAFTTFKHSKNNKLEGHILAIHLPYSAPGAYVHHHTMTHEFEMILPRGLTLNIDHSKRRYAPIPHMQPNEQSFYTIHHATIEPPKE